MKRLLLTLCCTLATALFADTWTDPKTNITWTYTLSNGTVSLGGGSDSTPAIPTTYTGALTIPTSIAGYPVRKIGDYAFTDCAKLTAVVIPDGVEEIGSWAFWFCGSLAEVSFPEGLKTIGYGAFAICSDSLREIFLPSSVVSIGQNAFRWCPGMTWVGFMGDVPSGWGKTGLEDKQISFSQAYSYAWLNALNGAQRGMLVDLISKAGVTVAAEMTTPKTMRVTYAVESEQPTVKVRVVAWKDGVRSFANIVPVKTAAEGSPEAVPNGGEVTTGEEHTFVWQVSANWATDLDKVAMEILVEEGTLLPQEKITIPALVDHPEMAITRNRLVSWQLFDALVWCYAEEDEALTVTNGVVRVNGTQVANGATLSTANTNATALLNYLYGKMGYKVLAGEDLAWARAATRLELADSGLNQVSVKIAEE